MPKKNDKSVYAILMKPRSWPITVKLSVVMLLFSILPMLVTTQYGLNRALENIMISETENLQRFAIGLATKMELVIDNTHSIATYLSWDHDVAAVLRNENDQTRARVLDKFLRLQASNSAIDLIKVMDASGKTMASTTPSPPNLKLNFRAYFQEALKGNNYVSSIEVGYLTKKAGMYFSAPVIDSQGTVLGVTVLKLKASAVTSITDEINKSGSKRAYIVDSDGILLHHPDSRLLYRSLALLPADVKKRIVMERQFMLDDFESLGLDTLYNIFKSSRDPGYATYLSSLSHQNELVGFAPLKRMGWTVAVEQPETALTVPLRRIYRDFMTGVAVFALFLTLITIFFAGTFVKPLRVVMEAAKAVERGDYRNAYVVLSSEDEIGEMSKTFNTMVEGVQARERERDILGRVVSPEVRDKLLSGDVNLVGENRRVSILFSDIRGFSALSEQMYPHEMVSMLNEYLGEMSEAVRHHGGYINNFIGDAIVVIFGAPLGWDDNEERALRAAVEMRARLKILNTHRENQGEHIIVSGIGISTGKVVAGQVGTPERFLYTVIGDAVNIASRLETLTKDYPDNPILINAATYEKVKDVSGYGFNSLGAVLLKGKVEAVDVYACYPDAIA